MLLSNYYQVPTTTINCMQLNCIHCYEGRVNLWFINDCIEKCMYLLFKKGSYGYMLCDVLQPYWTICQQNIQHIK